MKLKYEVKIEESAVRIIIADDLDMHVAGELRKVLRGTFTTKPSVVIVDLAQVRFIYSSGIATLIEALKNLRAWNGALRVENSSETVRDTFDIAGLREILGIA
jgi:anti-sigma B factor antagonist